MRISFVTVAAALTVMTVATAVESQRPDADIDPRSMALLAKARTEASAAQLDAATDDLETALAVDPRNRAAFVELGAVSSREGLYGKAIRHYRDALRLDPNDPNALSGEGSALVAKGAVTQAKADLAKLDKVCAGGCPARATLAAAIAKGPPPTVLAEQADKPAVVTTGKE